MSLEFFKVTFQECITLPAKFRNIQSNEIKQLNTMYRPKSLWTIISQPFHFTNKTTKNMLCRLQLTVNLHIILFLVTIIIAKSFISFVIWKSIFSLKMVFTAPDKQIDTEKLNITSINIWKNDINYKNPLQSGHKV